MTADTTAPAAPVTGRPACPHVAAPGPICRCGHGVDLHDLRNGQRSSCSVHTGAKATSCGCKTFTEMEVSG